MWNTLILDSTNPIQSDAFPSIQTWQPRAWIGIGWTSYEYTSIWDIEYWESISCSLRVAIYRICIYIYMHVYIYIYIYRTELIWIVGCIRAASVCFVCLRSCSLLRILYQLLRDFILPGGFIQMHDGCITDAYVWQDQGSDEAGDWKTNLCGPRLGSCYEHGPT